MSAPSYSLGQFRRLILNNVDISYANYHPIAILRSYPHRLKRLLQSLFFESNQHQ